MVMDANTKQLSIVFFGSGPVAAASLAFLHEHFVIECVITKNTPSHHKDPAPVEAFAKDHNLPINYADNRAQLDSILQQTKLTSPCGVVIDYGVIISQAAINTFPLGIINSHFSLLPQWRGADPITFSLLSGQKETGVCLMKIDAGLDTGEIIAQTPVRIDPDETNKSLTVKLIEASNAQISAILPLYIQDKAQPLPQDTQFNVVTYSRKLNKHDGWLDVSKPASMLEREIRAFSDWPKSKISLTDNLVIIVTKAQSSTKQLAQGQIDTSENKLLIGTRVGSIEILELMPLGKQKMTTAAFLNGYRGRFN